MAWKAFIDPRPWKMTARLFLVREELGGKQSVIKPIEAEVIEQGLEMIPALDLDIGDMRSLCTAIAQAAWEQGWRPQAAQDHKNELTATRAHLDDMRRISFLAVEGKFEEEK